MVEPTMYTNIFLHLWRVLTTLLYVNIKVHGIRWPSNSNSSTQVKEFCMTKKLGVPKVWKSTMPACTCQYTPSKHGRCAFPVSIYTELWMVSGETYTEHFLSLKVAIIQGIFYEFRISLDHFHLLLKMQPLLGCMGKFKQRNT